VAPVPEKHGHNKQKHVRVSVLDKADGSKHDIPGNSHSHTHTHTKAILNRLSRAIGHLESVKRMVEDDRDCAEVLIQLAAVRSAIGNTAKIVLKDHIEHCIVDAIESDNTTALDELNKAIELFM
jgi:DNA-binding FrmR family transcriptional regulator